MIEWKAELVIYGTPVPQPRPRISTRGGFAKAYTPADHPVVKYRNDIVAAALSIFTPYGWSKQLNRKVRLEVLCVFQRPKSHYKSNGQLTSKAPDVPRPDTDNLVKAVMDALTTAGVYTDDTLVVDVRCRKRYVGPRTKSHTVIRLR
jgi:Holliday junction resolvase RusA-like endonuclease